MTLTWKFAAATCFASPFDGAFGTVAERTSTRRSLLEGAPASRSSKATIGAFDVVLEHPSASITAVAAHVTTRGTATPRTEPAYPDSPNAGTPYPPSIRDVMTREALAYASAPDDLPHAEKIRRKVLWKEAVCPNRVFPPCILPEIWNRGSRELACSPPVLHPAAVDSPHPHERRSV